MSRFPRHPKGTGCLLAALLATFTQPAWAVQPPNEPHPRRQQVAYLARRAALAGQEGGVEADVEQVLRQAGVERRRLLLVAGQEEGVTANPLLEVHETIL